MPRNVEIKTFVDNLASVMKKAAELSQSEGQKILQRDTFFNVSNGRLKLRHLQDTDAQLIYYSRSDQEGPKLSDYHIAASNVPEDLSNVLEKTIGIKG